MLINNFLHFCIFKAEIRFYLGSFSVYEFCRPIMGVLVVFLVFKSLMSAIAKQKPIFKLYTCKIFTIKNIVIVNTFAGRRRVCEETRSNRFDASDAGRAAEHKDYGQTVHENV